MSWIFTWTKIIHYLLDYGGCGGNDNNFKSDRECESRCAGRDQIAVPTRTQSPATRPPHREPEPEPEREREREPDTHKEVDTRFDARDKSQCIQHYDAGSCDGESIRYYYDSYYGVCSHFRMIFFF